jgi:hypothetical protein
MSRFILEMDEERVRYALQQNINVVHEDSVLARRFVCAIYLFLHIDSVRHYANLHH